MMEARESGSAPRARTLGVRHGGLLLMLLVFGMSACASCWKRRCGWSGTGAGGTPPTKPPYPFTVVKCVPTSNARNAWGNMM